VSEISEGAKIARFSPRHRRKSLTGFATTHKLVNVETARTLWPTTDSIVLARVGPAGRSKERQGCIKGSACWTLKKHEFLVNAETHENSCFARVACNAPSRGVTLRAIFGAQF
jgi:hypothetical protein